METNKPEVQKETETETEPEVQKETKEGEEETEGETKGETKGEEEGEEEGEGETKGETETKGEGEGETKGEGEGEEETKEGEEEGEEEEEETEEEEPKEPELSWFERIKRDFKTKGNFPKIDPLGFLPPFPAVAVLQVLSSANKLFQDNLPKVGEYATLTIDTEIAKKKHNLELIDALAEQTKHSNLENQVDDYVDHVLESNNKL